MDRRRQSPHAHGSTAGSLRSSQARTPTSPGPSTGNGVQRQHDHEGSGAAAPTPQSPQPSGGGNFHIHRPNEQRRQKLVDMAQREEEELQRYRAAQSQQQGSFQGVSQRLGTGAAHGRSPSDLSAVRSAQQQQSRVSVMTKSTRDQAKRERFREETRRQEDEQFQRHKEKQRLKAQELELKKKEKEIVCQTSTRRHWEDRTVHTERLYEDASDTCQPRSQVFPSQHAKYRQYREDQKRAEEAECERYKASQRQKGEYLKARAEEEGRRVQAEVRRSWAVPSNEIPMQETDPHDSSHSPEAVTPDESALPQCDQRPLKSALKSSPTVVPQTAPAARHDHPSLKWPSNKRPASAAAVSGTTYDTKQLTECQDTLCSLGLQKLSMVELDVLLKRYNGNMDRLANKLLTD